MQEENQPDLFTDISIDHTAKQHILSIASWAMIMVVVAVIGYVLSIFQLFAAPKQLAVRSEGFDMTTAFTGDSISFTFGGIIIGLLINFFLYRFASMARNGVNNLNQDALNKSFNSLKIYFVIMSAILILVFAACLLIVVGAALNAA